jgi:hypothetical protein
VPTNSASDTAIVTGWKRKAPRSVQSYSFSQPVKTLSIALYIHPWRCVCGGRRKRLASIGVRLIDTMPEIRIATPIVTANSCSRRPTIPPMKRTGMKTAMSETVIERIVNEISFDPS